MPRLHPIPDELVGRTFTSSTGRAFGLTPTRLGGSDLLRPFHGVRSTVPVHELRDRVRAYAHVMSEEAFLCGPTAAELHGFPLPNRLVDMPELHVAVPNPGRAPRGAGVAGHKFVVTPRELTDLGGHRITSLVRTWCDLAAYLNLVELVAAGDWLLRRAPELRPELENLARRHPGRSGRATRLTAVRLIDPRSESPKETEVRLLLTFAGLVGFIPNLEVVIGRWTYRLDIAWPGAKIALEYQGGYHNDPEQWRRDMIRRSRLEADGWTIVFIGAADLRDPRELIARIRAIAARKGVVVR